MYTHVHAKYCTNLGCVLLIMFSHQVFMILHVILNSKKVYFVEYIASAHHHCLIVQLLLNYYATQASYLKEVVLCTIIMMC